MSFTMTITPRFLTLSFTVISKGARLLTIFSLQVCGPNIVI